MENVFLLMVIPLTIIYLVIMLPWTVPDAISHFMATYRFSSIFFGYSGADEWTGRVEDINFWHNVWEKGKPFVDMQGIQNIFINTKVLATDTQIGSMPLHMEHMKFYSCVGYLPQIVGISLGRMLHLGSIPTVYLGRIITMITYICVCYRAVKKAPIGKFIFATIPLLPVCLMMSSAFSYDVMVIMSSISFIVCILRLYKNPECKAILYESIFWTFVLGATKGGGYLILLPLVFVLFDKNDKKRSLIL